MLVLGQREGFEVIQLGAREHSLDVSLLFRTVADRLD